MKLFQKTNVLHHIFFAVLIGALSLGQLQKLPLSFGAALYVHDVVIALWLLTTGLSSYCFKQPWKKYTTSPSVLLGVWILLITILTAVRNHQLLPLLYMLRLGMYTGLLVALARSKILKSQVIVQGVLSIGMLWAIFGVVQLTLAPDLRSLRWIGFDDHYYRLTSTFFDPNFAGIGLVLTFIFLQIVVLQKKVILSWWQNTGLSLVLFGSIAATYSRATYLSISIVILFILLQKKFPKKALLTTYALGMLFALSVWLLLPKPGGEGVALARTASIIARIDASFSEIANLSPTEWIVGHGMYTQAPSTQEYQGSAVPNHARVPDNIFVLLLTSGGVIGLILGVLALREWYYTLLAWHPFAPAALIALLIHAQFNNSLFEPTLFLFIGLGVIALQTSITKQT